jgi:hypothetical protein
VSGVWASYVVFEEEELIAESVRSLAAYVDGFIFMDSAYVTNDAPTTHSRDRTRERATAAAGPLAVRYYEATAKWALEPARNRALAMVPQDAWALIVDGDETLLGDHAEVEAEFDAIRRGERSIAVGVSVFTTALRFAGHAPRISEAAYAQLPVIATRGAQPRLVQASACRWRRVPGGRTYGVYRGNELVSAPATSAFVLVNHRTRQTYAAYQGDYIWETREDRGVARLG